MFKDTKKMIAILNAVGESRTKSQFVNLLAFKLDEVLSLVDFNVLLESLEDEIESD